VIGVHGPAFDGVASLSIGTVISFVALGLATEFLDRRPTGHDGALMAMATCDDCGSSDIGLLETLPDTRRHVTCLDCGHDWFRGEPARVPTATTSSQGAQRRFPRPSDVSPERLAWVEELRVAFLARRPEPDPAVTDYWLRYQQIFSPEGLREAAPEELKDFANTATGAYPGNMSVLNTEWNALGPAEASQRVRDTVRYLLYGPDHTSMEDRLTQLIRRYGGLGMKGLNESLLTKVLCIMQPERFLPILMYSGVSGKREIAEAVYGLDLPPKGATSMTPGRLVFWSNDLLLALVGDGFATKQHASQFLWEAKDQAAAASS